MLINSLSATPLPATQPKVTSQQIGSCLLDQTTTTCMTSFSRAYRPSEPVEESFSLDSIVMVPFLRIPGHKDKQCASDDDYRYICAAKFLGFYRISDRSN